MQFYIDYKADRGNCAKTGLYYNGGGYNLIWQMKNSSIINNYYWTYDSLNSNKPCLIIGIKPEDRYKKFRC